MATFKWPQSFCDQVLAVALFIENGFDHKKKRSTALVDISADYDTDWRKGHY